MGEYQRSDYFNYSKITDISPQRLCRRRYGDICEQLITFYRADIRGGFNVKYPKYLYDLEVLNSIR